MKPLADLVRAAAVPAVRESRALADPALRQAAVVWLCERSPATVDLAIERRAAEILGRPLQLRERPVDDFAAMRIERIEPPATLTGQQLAQLLEVLELALLPAPEARVTRALAELGMMVVGQLAGGSSDDLRVRTRLYADRCAAYPADVVIAALSPNNWRMFPAWFDLQQQLATLSARRRSLRRIIGTWCPTVAPQPELKP